MTFRRVPTYALCCGHRIDLDMREVPDDESDGRMVERGVYVCRRGCCCTTHYCMPDRSEATRDGRPSDG